MSQHNPSDYALRDALRAAEAAVARAEKARARARAAIRRAADVLAAETEAAEAAGEGEYYALSEVDEALADLASRL